MTCKIKNDKKYSPLKEDWNYFYPENENYPKKGTPSLVNKLTKYYINNNWFQS